MVPERGKRRAAAARKGPGSRAPATGPRAGGAPEPATILALLAKADAPLTADALARQAGARGPASRALLTRHLRALEREGAIVRTRRGGYGLARRMDLVAGRVVAHPDGFGFLDADESDDDVYLSAPEMRSLMHGDRALARIVGFGRNGRREGAVVEVLERNTVEVVGRYWDEAGVAVVRPDNRRLHHEVIIAPDGAPAAAGAEQRQAANGEMVVARIIEQPDGHRPPIGRVTEVLGERFSPGMEVDLAIRSSGLPDRWPEGVVEEAERLRGRPPADRAGDREDLRDLPLVTIDGADAKDFDDAVWCRRTPGGWRLVVAIADVAAHVAIGSRLDQEAHRRGTSAYFPGRVVPMLPEALSNDLCSLRPDEDRLCVACEILVARDGTIRRSRFADGVMRSRARLTYDTVAAAVVERDPAVRETLGQLTGSLDELHQLYLVLKQARDARGGIELDTVETRIDFDDKGRPASISPIVRNDAHRIIEECMIAANVCAGRLLQRRRIPGLYRVHQGPREERLDDLRAFLSEIGLSLGGGHEPEPRHFAALAAEAADRPDAHLVQTLLLRSLSQAAYEPRNAGHFGLALDCYAHFTSPIRRYPDLLVHRAIKHSLGGSGSGAFPYTHAAMVAEGEHASMAERRADDASRDVVQRLKCEFMEDKVGETFDGVVSGVTGFGLFVSLDRVHVDGLVHVSALGEDYFHFDPARHQLKGERSGRAYGLGARIAVRVVRVDRDLRRVDLEPAAPKEGRGKGPRRSRLRRGRRRGRRG